MVESMVCGLLKRCEGWQNWTARSRASPADAQSFIDVDRERGLEAPEATFVIPDLNGLPEIVRG